MAGTFSRSAPTIDPPDPITPEQDPPTSDPSESDVPATGAGGIHADAQQCLTPQPPPPQTPMSADQDPPRGDPSESAVPACALRCGPQGVLGGVADVVGAPSVADGVHGDDQTEERDVTEDAGRGGMHAIVLECLTPHSGCGVVPPSDQGSPMPLAQRPPPIMLSGQDSDMSSPNVHGSLGIACTVMAPSQLSTDGSQLSKKPPSGKKAVPRDPNPMPAAKCLRVGDDMAAPIEVDNPNQTVEEAPSKAEFGRDLPTIRQLKFWLEPDDYTLGACFFFCSYPEPPCSPQADPLI